MSIQTKKQVIVKKTSRNSQNFEEESKQANQKKTNTRKKRDMPKESDASSSDSSHLDAKKANRNLTCFQRISLRQIKISIWKPL